MARFVRSVPVGRDRFPVARGRDCGANHSFHVAGGYALGTDNFFLGSVCDRGAGRMRGADHGFDDSFPAAIAGLAGRGIVRSPRLRFSEGDALGSTSQRRKHATLSPRRPFSA